MSDTEHAPPVTVDDASEHAANDSKPSTEATPVATAAARLDDDGDESQLSDLDDEIFADYNEPGGGRAESIPIDEDTIVNLGKFKKQKGSAGAGGEVKEKKRRRRDKATRLDDEPDTEQPVAEIELTEEEKRRRDLDRKMDEALKGPKKKKRRKNDHDLERMDDETVENLRLAMLEAAKCDTEAVDNNLPATHKLAMVDEVRDLLGRQTLLSVAVDCGILKGIRRWLEPLPNKSLPAYNVQKLMFEILAKLKPDFTHLQESGIGKIVMFYTKDARPERHIKREAEKLVRDWSRPILGRSDDYRSREVPKAGDSRPLPASRPRNDSVDDTNNPRAALAAPKKNTGRATVMMPSSQSYEIAPKDRVVSGSRTYAKPMSAQGEAFIRKMKAKKAKAQR